MKLQLKKFDMNKVKSDSVVVMIGARNTGKSFLVRDLLYHHQNLPVGMVISGTEGSNEFYSTMIPPLFIHEEYQPELVEKFVKRQKMITKKSKKENQLYGRSDIDPRAFLILDDCLYDKAWTNDKNIRYCFLNGRHSHVFFIFTSQYALAAPPVLRNNIDWVFVLREPRYGARKKLHENFAGFVPSFDMWNTVMNAATENYECLVIDNTTKSNKLTDQLYWYKAEGHVSFTLGAKEFWLLHNQNYNDDEEDDEDELFSMEAFNNSKKKGPLINVQKTYD
jgi:hypothetical protein